MAQTLKFYGFLTPSSCYHESPSCPVIKHAAKKGRIEIREYGSERFAAIAGHIRRCRLCLGRKVFDLDGARDRVRLSNGQHGALKIIADIFSRDGAMTLRDISERRDRSVVSTYLIVKRLRELGLVEHKLKIGAQRASGRSIVPTERGLAVIKTKALDDMYTPL